MQIKPSPAPLESMARLLENGVPGLIYETGAFLRFLERCAGGRLEALEFHQGGELMGAMPYFRNEHPEFGVVVNSLPWFGSHGGCLVRPEAGTGACRVLLDAFRQQLAEEKRLLTATVSLSPFRQEQAELYAEALRPDYAEPRTGQVLLLPPGLTDAEDSVLQQAVLSLALQKTRNLIRKSLSQGFTLQKADTDEAWDFLCTSHADNMQSIGGNPKPREHILAIRELFSPEQRKLYLAMLDGRPVAAMLCLYHAGHVEYFIPTVLHDYRPQQPLSFLICEGLVRAMREGFQIWNFGGSWKTQKSLHHFKAGWGATDMPYTVFVIMGPDAITRVRKNLAQLRSWAPFYYLVAFSLLEETP